MLSGIKVLDFTNNLAGPGAAAMLADHGADVIHIEKPVTGDDCRKFPPLVDGESLSSASVNRGKKSVVLNLKDPVSINIIRNMIADMDVLIESSRPGVMARLGLDYESVRRIKPDLIYCSVSAFGQTGPYSRRPGYDIIAQAYSGMLYYTGEPGSAPTKSCAVVGDQVGVLNAYSSIMTALYHRERTGEGQWIDVSLARGLLWLNSSFGFKYVGQKRQKMGNHDGQLCPYGIFKGRQDYAVIGAVSDGTWAALCRIMERPDLILDPRFSDNAERVKNQAAVIELVESWLQSFETIEEPIRMMQTAGVPCIKCYTMEDLEQDPHALECGWIQECAVPDGITSIPTLTCVCGIADFSAEKFEWRQARDLGQDNFEVLQQYGMTREEIEAKQREWTEDFWASRRNTPGET